MNSSIDDSSDESEEIMPEVIEAERIEFIINELWSPLREFGFSGI